MSRAGRVAGLLGLSAVAGGIAALFGNHTAVELAVLSTLVVVGELLELRPVGRAPLPLSFAVVVVLVRAGTPREVVVCAICAQVFSLFVRDGAGRLRAHTVVAAERITETLAAGAAYRVVIQALSGENEPQRCSARLAPQPSPRSWSRMCSCLPGTAPSPRCDRGVQTSRS